MLGQVHEYRIRKIVEGDEAFKTKGFKREVVAAIVKAFDNQRACTLTRTERDNAPEDHHCSRRSFDDVWDGYGGFPRPDAFKVDYEQGEELRITIVEVVGSNDLSEDKLMRYGDLLDWLSTWRIFVDIRVYSIHGALLGVYSDEDLMEWCSLGWERTCKAAQTGKAA